MTRSTVSFLPTLAALAGAAFATQLSLPTATGELEPTGAFQWSARPTEPPNFELVRRRLGVVGQLEKRAGELLGYVAPSNTCGFVDKDIGDEFTCSVGKTCAVLAGPPNMAGCCDSNGCGGFHFTCIPYASTALCNAACQTDTFTLVCSNSAQPYCGSWTYPELSATAWNCRAAPIPASIAPDVYFEASGNVDQISYTPIYNTSVATGATTGGPVLITSLVSTVTISPASPATSTPAPPTPTPKPSTPVGPIVGGVIGGLALIGAVAAAIVFMCIRKKPKTTPQGPNNPQAGIVPQVPPPQYQSPVMDPRYSVVSAPEYAQQPGYYNKEAYNMVSPAPTSPMQGYSPQPGEPNYFQTAEPIPHQGQQQYLAPGPMPHAAAHPSEPPPGHQVYEIQG